MRIAILDPFSGIAGDMTLGALLAVGLDPDWLRALPGKLGLSDVTVEITKVKRADLACFKVDFAIPPQPHGRHIKAIQKIVADQTLVAPIFQQAFPWGVGARVAEPAAGLIQGYPYVGPPEDLRLK